nr:MAG TPA: zinc finger homeobox protein 4 [Caudoviricetes sp.]
MFCQVCDVTYVRYKFTGECSGNSLLESHEDR